MTNHICSESKYCCCSVQALEPDDQCPLHGHPWPPRCEACGRYTKWPRPEDYTINHGECQHVMGEGVIDKITEMLIEQINDTRNIQW